ncbi:hypothetical protein ON010_g10212 [Phytophthora cinnamomi]|nr:hypothetical protein ON010_g10212 [Phytophthora cinnamomi]
MNQQQQYKLLDPLPPEAPISAIERRFTKLQIQCKGSGLTGCELLQRTLPPKLAHGNVGKQAKYNEPNCLWGVSGLVDRNTCASFAITFSSDVELDQMIFSFPFHTEGVAWRLPPG